MIFFIIVSIIVVITIWFLGDKFTTNVQYAAKPQAQKPQAQKPQAQKPPTRKPQAQQSIKKPKENVSINNALFQKNKQGQSIKKLKENVPINNALSQKKKGQGTQKPSGPSTLGKKDKDRLQKALAAYNKNNKSGKLDKNSVYADLVNAGHLKYDKTKKKWTISSGTGTSSGDTSSGGLQYKGANNKAPTYDRLEKAWKAYNKYNKSGKVDPSSSYADLVKQGYLQFKNGKWVRYLEPGGKPPVVGGPSSSGGSSSGGSGGSSSGSSSGSGSGSSSGGSGGLPRPKKDAYGNEAYGDEGQYGVLTAKQYAQQTGYALSDPGNLIEEIRDCNGTCALVTSQDAQKVKAINDKIIANGGVPIGYMSTTIENNNGNMREDTKGLKQNKDYISEKLDNWDEFIPKGQNGAPTPAYVQMMKKRIDLMKQAGYKGVEIDNIDILDNDMKNGKHQSGITKEKWYDFLKDMSQYAQKQGINLIQKNAPDMYKPSEMIPLFGGMSLETHSTNNSTSQFHSNTKDINWDQVKAMSDAGKPVLVTQYGQGGCNSIKTYMKQQGVNMDNVYVTCQSHKAGH
jgi:endo-alpha-1,4-polygalactosaminidase (GH114 family)